MRCVAHDTHLFQWPQPPPTRKNFRKGDFGHKNAFLAHIFVCVSGVRWRMRTKSSGSTLCVHPRARPPAPPTSPTSPSARSCTHGRHFYVRERAGASVNRVGVGLQVCVCLRLIVSVQSWLPTARWTARGAHERVAQPRSNIHCC